jgi:hypothetical protein
MQRFGTDYPDKMLVLRSSVQITHWSEWPQEDIRHALFPAVVPFKQETPIMQRPAADRFLLPEQYIIWTQWVCFASI